MMPPGVQLLEPMTDNGTTGTTALQLLEPMSANGTTGSKPCVDASLTAAARQAGTAHADRPSPMHAFSGGLQQGDPIVSSQVETPSQGPPLAWTLPAAKLSPDSGGRMLLASRKVRSWYSLVHLNGEHEMSTLIYLFLLFCWHSMTQTLTCRKVHLWRLISTCLQPSRPLATYPAV